jgi:hypothetical protein
MCSVITPLHVLGDHADACAGRIDAAANDLPSLTLGLAEFPHRPRHDLFPVGERIRPILLAAEITKHAPARLTRVVAVTLDQVIASRIAGSA